MSYPQPHEGIAGTEQDEDGILSLKDEAFHLRVKVWDLAYEIHGLALGNRNFDIYTGLIRPALGSFVIVIDAAFYRDPFMKVQGSGILIERRAEWWTTDEDWEVDRAAALADGVEPERSVDRDVAYIQYGPGAKDVCRWTNCQVIGTSRVDNGLTGA